MHEPTLQRAMAGLALFDGLAETELTELAGGARLSSVPGRSVLMSLEQPGEVVYLIVDGTVRVQVEQEDGSLVVLAFLGPGDMVGEMSALEGTGRSATVVTLEPCHLLWIDRRTFRLALETMPRLTLNLLTVLSRRLRLANAHIQSLSTLDVPGRVARQLLAFAREYGEPSADGGVYIPLRLTQADLACTVGASRERVNKALATMRRKGHVRVDHRHRMTVLDLDGLSRWC